MERLYKAVALLTCGRSQEEKGTFDHVARWGDMMRQNGDDTTVLIRCAEGEKMPDREELERILMETVVDKQEQTETNDNKKEGGAE